MVSAGVVHDLPEDMKSVLSADLLDLWEDLTPLARNEWICWITDAKKQETREKRIAWMRDDLQKGKRRPCCWPGCSHR